MSVQPDVRSTGMKRASRSSPPRASGGTRPPRRRRGDSDHGWRDARRVAYVWTCPRPASARRSRPPSPRRRGGAAGPLGLPVLARPAGRASRSSGRTAAPVTAPRSGPPAHPHPARSQQQDRLLARWPISSATSSRRHDRLPDGRHDLRLPRPPQSRSRLLLVHHLHPVRRPGRARLLQPADVGGSDPRAQPAAAVLAAGERAATAAAKSAACWTITWPATAWPHGGAGQQRRHVMTNTSATRRVPGHRSAISSRARPADHWCPGRRHAVLRQPAHPELGPCHLRRARHQRRRDAPVAHRMPPADGPR